MPLASMVWSARLTQIIADRLNDSVFDENGIGLSERAFQFPSDQCADIFDQDGRHERTIAKPRYQKKRGDL